MTLSLKSWCFRESGVFEPWAGLMVYDLQRGELKKKGYDRMARSNAEQRLVLYVFTGNTIP